MRNRSAEIMKRWLFSQSKSWRRSACTSRRCAGGSAKDCFWRRLLRRMRRVSRWASDYEAFLSLGRTRESRRVNDPR